MPLTSATNLIASMSIAGVPPFNGFWSKLLIIIAAVGAGRFGYALWAVLVSILTLAMYMKVLKYAFFGKLNEKLSNIKEVPIFMQLSMVFLAFICIVGGILFFPAINEIFLQKAQAVLLGGINYAVTVLGGVS